jgi:hypothetical protein
MCAASGNYLFKDYIVKAFLYSIAAYPSGSFVELNNGHIGAVIDTPKGFSTFPRVMLLFDSDHNRITVPQEISLIEKGNLFVTNMLTLEEAQSL